MNADKPDDMDVTRRLLRALLEHMQKTGRRYYEYGSGHWDVKIRSWNVPRKLDYDILHKWWTKVGGSFQGNGMDDTACIPSSELYPLLTNLMTYLSVCSAKGCGHAVASHDDLGCKHYGCDCHTVEPKIDTARLRDLPLLEGNKSLVLTFATEEARDNFAAAINAPTQVISVGSSKLDPKEPDHVSV